MRVSVMRIRFNPRTQVGCDYDRLVSPAPDERFNPRTHVGCDHGEGNESRVSLVSIHAPT